MYLSGGFRRVAPAIDDGPCASDCDDRDTAIRYMDVSAICRIVVSFLILSDAERFNREIIASIARGH